MLNDIYTDPLTGAGNLFDLLECDIEEFCGNEGTILVIDMIQLKSVNDSFGRQTGDVYIKSLANIFYRVMFTHYIPMDKFKLFRYGGDEFIVIIPGMTDFEYSPIVAQIDSELHDEMAKYDISNAGIHWAAWTYTSRISSAAALIKNSSIALSKSKLKMEASSDIPQWADDLIEKMLQRVRDTIVLLKQANTLALNDEISGLPNHRAANILLTEVLEDYNLFRHPFSVLFIDGDNLKRYNELGYQQGNQMIRNLGSLITGTLRQNDKVFRWLSGDEFVVVLKETNRESAHKLGERIRLEIEEATKAWAFPVTVSIGIATCPQDGVVIEDIIAKAETANAQAKRSGKNCIV